MSLGSQTVKKVAVAPEDWNLQPACLQNKYTLKKTNKKNKNHNNIWITVHIAITRSKEIIIIDAWKDSDQILHFRHFPWGKTTNRAGDVIPISLAVTAIRCDSGRSISSCPHTAHTHTHIMGPLQRSVVDTSSSLGVWTIWAEVAVLPMTLQPCLQQLWA